jgi:hypothetical protein
LLQQHQRSAASTGTGGTTGRGFVAIAEQQTGSILCMSGGRRQQRLRRCCRHRHQRDAGCAGRCQQNPRKQRNGPVRHIGEPRNHDAPDSITQELWAMQRAFAGRFIAM